MNHLHTHYNSVIIYDLITKLNLKNTFQIPKFNKIILNIGLKNSNLEKKKMIAIILLLKLITNQTALCTKSKKNNIIFKIKKGSIMGCTLTLRRKNLFIFLEKLIIFIIPNIKNFEGFILKKNILNFQLKNILNFFELEKEFLKFQNIPPIDISLHFTNNKNIEKFNLILNQFNIPLKRK